jgi:hypothetical protein
MKITHNFMGQSYVLEPTLKRYNNGQTCIQLIDTADGFPFATATVAVENDLLKEEEVAIKDYSENEGVLDTLLAHNIVEEPHAFIQSGFVKIPICKKGPAFQDIE